MLKKVIKLLIVALISLPLLSCWDSKDLEELLIVYGLGIDISEENPDNYVFTIAFPTIIEDAPEKKVTFSAEASSISRGRSNLQKKVYRDLSFDNIKIVVFNEDVAKQGLLFHMDSMFRVPLFRGTTRFAVSGGSANGLLQFQPPVSLLVTNFLFDSIGQNYNATNVPVTTLRGFSNQYYTTGIEPSMPFISYGDTQNDLKIDRIALFKEDKMIHVLTGINSRAFMMLKGEIKDGVHTFEFFSEETGRKEFLSVNVIDGKSKIKTEIKDNQLHIYQEVSINAHLGEYTAREKIFSTDQIKRLEDIINHELKLGLDETLKILQKDLECDNIGYGKYVKGNHPEYFDPEDWNSQFAEAMIHINPTIQIRTVGVTP